MINSELLRLVVAWMFMAAGGRRDRGTGPALPRPAPRRKHVRGSQRGRPARPDGPDGHESERAALIYQHEARGADAAITSAIDAYVDAERSRYNDDGQAEARPRRLMARRAKRSPETIKAQAWDSRPDLGLPMRAGDGNRTRTISLGNRLRLFIAHLGNQARWT